jgi:hypothetical protein
MKIFLTSNISYEMFTHHVSVFHELHACQNFFLFRYVKGYIYVCACARACACVRACHDTLDIRCTFYTFLPVDKLRCVLKPLTEMSTRSRKLMFLGSEVWPVHRADNLAAICEPTV